MRVARWAALWVSVVSGLWAVGAWAAPAGSLSVQSRSVSAGGRSYSVRVVRVPLGSYQVKVGLAGKRVGATAPLESIAKQYGAVAAINGCFFSAYTSDPIKPPYHHLITGGQVVHHGNTGTTLGFDGEGNYRMDQVRIRIEGTVGPEGERGARWYAYRVNHPLDSSSAAGFYNTQWAGGKSPAGGTQVLVRNGKVVSVGGSKHPVPADGYVLLFAGGERNQAARFGQGMVCEQRTVFEAQEPEFWEGVREGLGCGPQLVRDGAVAYNPKAEGFTSAKILSNSGQRSAVGITRDGTLLLVTCAATVRQLADVMRALGAYDAMNLDGGASSGLWAQGRYLSRPGRNISNALLILKK